MPIITITEVPDGIQISITDLDGTAIIPGMIRGITEVIRIITAAGTARGITADGIHLGIMEAGTARGTTAAGILHGITADFMIRGTMVTVMAAGMAAVTTGDSITDIMLRFLQTDQAEALVLTDPVQPTQSGAHHLPAWEEAHPQLAHR